jgi:hypothetical protein
MTFSLTAFEQDIANGRWEFSRYVVAAVERKAEELSAAHSAAIGCRTLDIVHIAAAIVIGVEEFVTFDVRQSSLAAAAGLTVRS